ncbi:MAG TPA: DUF2007 domain-containing protein [Candidatus Competibacteraceae bacterium]|nr:DUF2007 domain-containing protein [Candidatus Competibacteraceae bacterium]HQA25245.1 DUF2007 domain-containing protein [Candidatus Competibacteraceae bacterium]HQD56137.1 DUF2007 domain-containing protein [Candidatus Competibacteraceae bacterium]
MTAPWVTVTVFDALPLAEIVRGRLVAEGVPCALADRSLLSIGIVAGGLELQVPESELERARSILAQDFSGDLDQEF